MAQVQVTTEALGATEPEWWAAICVPVGDTALGFVLPHEVMLLASLENVHASLPPASL